MILPNRMPPDRKKSSDPTYKGMEICLSVNCENRAH